MSLALEKNEKEGKSDTSFCIRKKSWGHVWHENNFWLSSLNLNIFQSSCVEFLEYGLTHFSYSFHSVFPFAVSATIYLTSIGWFIPLQLRAFTNLSYICIVRMVFTHNGLTLTYWHIILNVNAIDLRSAKCYRTGLNILWRYRITDSHHLLSCPSLTLSL